MNSRSVLLPMIFPNKKGGDSDWVEFCRNARRERAAAARTFSSRVPRSSCRSVTKPPVCFVSTHPFYEVPNGVAHQDLVFSLLVMFLVLLNFSLIPHQFLETRYAGSDWPEFSFRTTVSGSGRETARRVQSDGESQSDVKLEDLVHSALLTKFIDGSCSFT